MPIINRIAEFHDDMTRTRLLDLSQCPNSPPAVVGIIRVQQRDKRRDRRRLEFCNLAHRSLSKGVISAGQLCEQGF